MRNPESPCRSAWDGADAVVAGAADDVVCVRVTTGVWWTAGSDCDMDISLTGAEVEAVGPVVAAEVAVVVAGGADDVEEVAEVGG